MNQETLISVLHDIEIKESGTLKRKVTSIENDHRKIQPGSCYIAIRGERFDGHQILDEAVGLGAELLIVESWPDNADELSNTVTLVKVPSTYRAQAILANRFLGEPSTRLNVVAITGTNGKTTTAMMINHALETLGRTTGLIGTLQYKVGTDSFPAANTTPNAVVLQQLFHQMIEADCTDAVIEASSHALQLGRLAYTDVDCAIFTNLSREHFDFHKTMENYAFSKSLLFSQLGQRLTNGQAKLAILNADDEYASIMGQVTSAEIVTYSLVNPQATAYADAIKHNQGGMTFELHYQHKAHTISLPMLGTYNISNYLAAFLTLVEYYHYSPVETVQALSTLPGVVGRMEMIDLGQPYDIVVDFAHTPDAIKNVLVELTKKPHQRIITLMGHSGGNRDSGARPEIGDVLFNYSDYVVLTADNPRHEDVTKICLEMVGTHQAANYTIIEQRDDAVRYALSIAKKGDIILFAGKGGENYQLIQDTKFPYDEVAIIRDYLMAHQNEEESHD